MNIHSLPFRFGTSSYIVPADILPNVQYLAGKVQDIELVLFEVDEEQNNLPSAEVLDELIRLASLFDLTYTVHLPLDLKLGADGSEQDLSLIKAYKVIELTKRLKPWAYVLHLEGKDVRDSKDREILRRWQDQAVRALEIVAEWAGGSGHRIIGAHRFSGRFTDRDRRHRRRGAITSIASIEPTADT